MADPAVVSVAGSGFGDQRGLTVYLQGVRVALWLGAAVILVAGGLTRRAVRSAPAVAAEP